MAEEHHGADPALQGRWACRFCRHDQYEHNLIVGCPHCRCAATPGEAGAKTDREMDFVIIRPGRYHIGYEPQPEEPRITMGAGEFVPHCPTCGALPEHQRNARSGS